MRKQIRILFSFTKFGIVFFVLLVGLAGYLLSSNPSASFNWPHLALFLLGMLCLSAGSLSLNQIQEVEMDRKMNRTLHRPLVTGELSWPAGVGLSAALLLVGATALSFVSAMTVALGLLVVLLYNGFYTLVWKPRWIFAAVPGALPGALPVTMGYAANSADIFSTESLYLFLILFLWQMPHFWALAIKYRGDYSVADVPVLPVRLGLQKTFLHMGMYTFVYVAVAMAAPWFVHAGWFHLALVVPFAAKVLIDFFRYLNVQSRWFSFFMSINLSVLIFVFVPAFEKWSLEPGQEVARRLPSAAKD